LGFLKNSNLLASRSSLVKGTISRPVSDWRWHKSSATPD